MNGLNSTGASGLMRIAFFHGLPGPHPVHERYARCIGARFFPAYAEQRWNQKVKQYYGILRHAFRLQKQVNDDVYLSECLQFTPLLLRLMKRSPRVIMIVSNETAYFLTAGRYGRWKRRILSRLFSSADGYLCVGRMETELVRDIVGTRAPVVEIPGFVLWERYREFSQVVPDLAGPRLLFVGNGPDGFRTWYKGLDVVTEAAKRVAVNHHDIFLDVVGEWSTEIMAEYGDASVRFHGKVADLVPYLRSASLYVHCGRGDSFGISVLEAMLAGLPALVSDLTGAKEAVEKVAAWLVVPCDPQAAANGIRRYLTLSPEERATLSGRAREVAALYTEERALTRFRQVFYDMVNGGTSSRSLT
jgi:glycosyltransferase involved in cell wall biosynthesis